MNLFRKTLGIFGGTANKKPEYNELVGRLYDKWKPGESTYRCLFVLIIFFIFFFLIWKKKRVNHGECTLTIENNGQMILFIKRTAQENEEIDPGFYSIFFAIFKNYFNNYFPLFWKI